MSLEALTAKADGRGAGRSRTILTRLAILAAGLVATALATLGALIGFDVLARRDLELFGYALAGAAIAGPLFGMIAALRVRRWGPLVTGCALAVVALAAAQAIFTATPSRGDDDAVPAPRADFHMNTPDDFRATSRDKGRAVSRIHRASHYPAHDRA